MGPPLGGLCVGVEMSDPLLVGCQSLPRGCHLVPTMPRCVCQKVKDMGLFWLQGSEISGNISLEMGLKCGASVNLSKNLSWVLYVIAYTNSEEEL